MSEETAIISDCTYSFPTPEFPFYHSTVTWEDIEGELEVTEVRVDGEKTRDFQVFHESGESYDKVLEQGVNPEVVTRVDWENDESYTLEFVLEDSSGNEHTKKVRKKAPSHGGYWDSNWSYYAGAVLSEPAGLDRNGEPVHVTVNVYEDRVNDPDEIRVVEIDPETGVPEEVPSQVYGADTWNVSDLVEQEPFRYQPTTTLEIVFPADVSPENEKVYLLFYGNSGAGPENYSTDLQVESEGAETIQNDYYSMKLAEESGFINEITMKQGLNSKLDHGMEPPGTVHWNPGIYAPPRVWSHASDWSPPGNSWGLDGDLMSIRKYWGEMPFDVDQASASVTYKFYANVPYVIVSTIIKIDEEIAVKAIRNGEFVFRRELFDEFRWQDNRGKKGNLKLDEARPHPSPAVRLAPDIPWLAFVNNEEGYGYGSIPLDYMNASFDGRPPRTTQSHFYVEVGPWVYWCRPIVNTFVTNNPQRMVKVPDGIMYLERTAYMGFPLHRQGGTKILETYQKRLSNPLELVELHMDTDSRVPEKWVQGIITEEFQELPPDEVFRPDQE